VFPYAQYPTKVSIRIGNVPTVNCRVRAFLMFLVDGSFTVACMEQHTVQVHAYLYRFLINFQLEGHTCISGRMPVLNAKAMVAKAPKALKALAVLLPCSE
jgi:hypothetical protein